MERGQYRALQLSYIELIGKKATQSRLDQNSPPPLPSTHKNAGHDALLEPLASKPDSRAGISSDLVEQVATSSPGPAKLSNQMLDPTLCAWQTSKLSSSLCSVDDSGDYQRPFSSGDITLSSQMLQSWHNLTSTSLEQPQPSASNP